MGDHRAYPSEAIGVPASTQYYKRFDYSFPVSVAVYGAPSPPPATCDSQRPSCWLRLYIALLIGLVVGFAVGVVVLYAVVQPQAPKYTIQDVNVYEFNLTTNNRGIYLSSDMLFTMKARNPNKILGVYYNEANAEVWYEGGQIGQGSLAPFYQGHKNTTLLLLHFTGTNVALPQSVGTTLGTEIANKQSVSLRVTTFALVRKKLGRWKLSTRRYMITCDVLMTVPGSGKTQILNKRCDLLMD